MKKGPYSQMKREKAIKISSDPDTKEMTVKLPLGMTLKIKFKYLSCTVFDMLKKMKWNA